MLAGEATTASSRSLKMRMLLILICLVHLERVSANPVAGSKTELIKNDLNPLNNTKTHNEVSNSRMTKILDRSSRALTHFAYPDITKYKEMENDLQSKDKMESNSKSIYIIPHMRPGRSDQLSTEENVLKSRKRDSDTLIPTLRFGRSDTSLIPTLRFGRTDTSLIPTLRFGRTDTTLIPTLRFGRSDTSLIPIPRLGRSSGGFEDTERLIYSNNKDMNRYNSAEKDDLSLYENRLPYSSILDSDRSENEDVMPSKREIDEETIIPYPRLGREEDSTSIEESSEITMKRESNDSLIPQIRYGRDSVKMKASEKPEYYILPNMRPGRSLEKVILAHKEKIASSVPGLVPYPRPGRFATDSEGFNGELFASSKKADSNFVEELIDTDNGNNNLNYFELSKELSKEPSKSEQFVIPYPRPGKRYLEKPDTNNKPHLFKVKTKASSYSDFVLPYPRPGKRSKKENVFETMPGMAESDFANNDEFGFEKQTEVRKRNGDYAEMFFDVPFAKLGSSELATGLTNALKNKLSHSNEYLSKSAQSGNILPYPRPGRDAEDDDYLIPQLRFGRSDSILPYPRLGRSNSILPYPRLGRSGSILPYPRLGRSNSILPYPRLGRSNSILPYPRFGRSDSILPYPQLGRSNSILPYPRLGRSKNVILPYPRPGRSDSILPYPRLGRSDSILPYPRLGRSDSILPYPTLGRSDSILPYPRLGKRGSNSILPYPRLGRSDSILPYPRLGRSDSILPYPRLGRSEIFLESVFNKDTVNESSESSDASSDDLNIETLQDYINREESTEHLPSNSKHNPSKKENEHILGGESVYLLPYPRPGRNA